MYQSFHLSPHYPGTGDASEIGEAEGKGYTINAPLGFGHGDGAVSQLFDEIFIPHYIFSLLCAHQLFYKPAQTQSSLIVGISGGGDSFVI
jgi:acetoin utilization deacetylase AcuC-like enzyme